MKFNNNYCSNRLLKKMLETCITAIKEHNDRIDEQDKKIQLFINNEKLEKNVTEVKNTYANITKIGAKEAVLIRPVNEEQKSSETQEEITGVIDPSKCGIRVENIKSISKGGIIVNCSNADSKGKLKNKMQEELGNKYKVEDAKLKKPKIKIKGTELKFINRENTDILQDIMEQNEIKEEFKEDLKIIRKYEKKSKRNCGIVIMEVSPNIFTEITKRGKLNAGWRECKVEEYFDIVQCYKCARFNHFAKDCENNITCFKCSGNHKTENCSNDFSKCINCEKTMDKLKIKLDCNHTAYDRNCPCLTRNIERIVNRTNYNL